MLSSPKFYRYFKLSESRIKQLTWKPAPIFPISPDGTCHSLANNLGVMNILLSFTYYPSPVHFELLCTSPIPLFLIVPITTSSHDFSLNPYQDTLKKPCLDWSLCKSVPPHCSRCGPCQSKSKPPALAFLKMKFKFLLTQDMYYLALINSPELSLASDTSTPT